MTGRFLSIADYRERERQAREGMGIAAIRAFAPVTFQDLGTPVRAESEYALQRYADAMQIGKSAAFWADRFRMSEHEIGLIRRCCDGVDAMSRELFDRPLRPLMDSAKAIELYRLVTSLSRAAGRPLTVLEIGPGGGYVSLFLAMDGHRCLTVDNTEGFYLWQNRLYRQIFDEGFVETAALDWSPALTADRSAAVVHLPWWNFVRLGELAETPSVDLVIAEDVLGEMDRLAIQFTLGLSARLLKTGEPGLLAFVSPGLQYKFTMKQIHAEICRFGFRNVRGRDFWMYAAPETALAAFGDGDKIRITLPPALAEVSPSAPIPAEGPGSAVSDIRDAIDLPAGMTSHDYRFLQVTGVDHPFGAG